MKKNKNNTQQKDRKFDSKNTAANRNTSYQREKALVEISVETLKNIVNSPLGSRIAESKIFDHIRLNLETADRIKSEVLKIKNEIDALEAEADSIELEIDSNGSLRLPKENGRLGSMFSESSFFLLQIEEWLKLETVKMQNLLKSEKVFHALDDSYFYCIECGENQVSVLNIVKETGISRNQVIQTIESLCRSKV